MADRTIQDLFGFLLADGRFESCDESAGEGYREAYFRSSSLVLRIVEQREVGRRGVVSTSLCFLVDPANQAKWCMFGKAVASLLGKKIEPARDLIELASEVRAHIDAVLALSRLGEQMPFEDFSRFAK